MSAFKSHLPAACQVAEAFNQALNERDLEALSCLLTPDTIFENTYPAPDGGRFDGREQVMAFWEEFMRSSSRAHIETEEIFGWEDRCVMRWRYTWEDSSGRAGHIRGVDVYRVRDGRIAEKYSYVKG